MYWGLMGLSCPGEIAYSEVSNDRIVLLSGNWVPDDPRDSPGPSVCQGTGYPMTQGIRLAPQYVRALGCLVSTGDCLALYVSGADSPESQATGSLEEWLVLALACWSLVCVFGPGERNQKKERKQKRGTLIESLCNQEAVRSLSAVRPLNGGIAWGFRYNERR
jgi:hypothetical protein